jgi:hypothetical protein
MNVRSAYETGKSFVIRFVASLYPPEKIPATLDAHKPLPQEDHSSFTASEMPTDHDPYDSHPVFVGLDLAGGSFSRAVVMSSHYEYSRGPVVIGPDPDSIQAVPRKFLLPQPSSLKYRVNACEDAAYRRKFPPPPQQTSIPWKPPPQKRGYRQKRK